MIGFAEVHADPILTGAKTETRRIGPRAHYKVGSEHLAVTNRRKPKETGFARIRFMDCKWQRLGEMTEAEARAEGYPDRNSYFRAFRAINRMRDASHMTVMNQHVWAYRFKVVERLRGDGGVGIPVRPAPVGSGGQSAREVRYDTEA